MKSNLLQRTRYACVWIKQKISKTIVFNPEFSCEFQLMLDYLDHSSRYKGSKQNFLDIFEYLAGFKSLKKNQSKKIKLNQWLESCLPSKTILKPQEYDDFLSDKNCLFVERFFHQKSIHLGSSRHVQIGPVQIKGVGRNMLVSRTDFIHSWGGATKLEGFYSYLISNLMNQQLPQGACPTFKIDLNGEQWAQISRVFNSFRIAQYSSALIPSEKNFLKKHLADVFATSSPIEMLSRASFQFATQTLLNCYNYSMIGENILIDGKIIDCESLYNGTNLDCLSFCIDLSIRGKRAQKIDIKKLKSLNYLASIFKGQADTMLCNSSAHGVMHALDQITEVYQDLFQVNLPDVQETFWDQLDKIQVLMTNQKFSKPIKQFIKKFTQIPCELTNRNSESYSFDWKNDLKGIESLLDQNNPFQVYFKDQSADQLFLRLRFNLKRPVFSNPLVGLFNKNNRMDMYREAAIFIQDIPKDPIETASKLNFDVNRASFLFPVILDSKGEAQLKSQNLKQLRKDLVFRKMKDNEIIFTVFFERDGLGHEMQLGIDQLPKNKSFIIFDMMNSKTKYHYLTRPLLIDPKIP